jgi:hypothetical protein
MILSFFPLWDPLAKMLREMTSLRICESVLKTLNPLSGLVYDELNRSRVTKVIMMAKTELERQETSLFGTSRYATRTETWAELVGVNLSVEFVDGHKGFIRLNKIANNKLYGKKLMFSPGEMNLVEAGEDISLLKEHIREVSLVDIKVVTNVIPIRPE